MGCYDVTFIASSAAETLNLVSVLTSNPLSMYSEEFAIEKICVGCRHLVFLTLDCSRLLHMNNHMLNLS